MWKNDFARLWPFLCIAILTILLCLIVTSTYGPGISSDSVYYMSTAENLVKGQGFKAFNGNPMAIYAPLYPLILAGFRFLGVETVTAGRTVNAFALGVVIFLLGVAFLSEFRKRYLAVVACLAVLLLTPLLRVAGFVWSEIVFVLFAVLFVRRLSKFLYSPSMSGLVAVSVFAMLCFLQRYAGVTVFVTGFIVIAFFTKGVGLKKRISYLAVFCFISCLPELIWVMRNYSLTSTLLGPRSSSPYTLKEVLYFTSYIASLWFMPEKIPFMLRLAIILFFMLASTFYIRKGNGLDLKGYRMFMPSLFFVTVYLVFIVWFAAFSAVNRMSYRYLVPISPFVIYLFFVLFDMAFSKGSARPKVRALISASLFSILSLWVFYGALRTNAIVNDKLSQGGGGYNTAEFKRSKILTWLGDTKVEGRIYSNLIPDGIYFVTGKVSKWIPDKREILSNAKRGNFEAMVEKMGEDLKTQDSMIVWFNPYIDVDMPSITELRKTIPLKLSAVFPDGTVWKRPE